METRLRLKTLAGRVASTGTLAAAVLTSPTGLTVQPQSILVADVAVRDGVDVVQPSSAITRFRTEQIASDSRITRVEHLAARWHIHERTLQRLFERYVGASPRWAIKRYRIYEALANVAVGADYGWAALAQDLGYFDQAHFGNEFRRLVGCSPAEYVRPAAE